MKDHRRVWPSRAVNVGNFCRALNIGGDGTTSSIPPFSVDLPHCPACGGSDLVRTAHHPGAPSVAYVCVRCCRRYDPVTLVRDLYKLSSLPEAVEWMAAREGILTSKKASSREVVADYCRHAKSVDAFNEVHKAAIERRLGVCKSDAHNALGIQERPHISGSHWTFTVGELAAIIGRHSDPCRDLCSDLKAADDAPAVVLPSLIGSCCIGGLWISASTYANGRNRWVWRGVYGADTSVYEATSRIEINNVVNTIVSLSPSDLVPEVMVRASQYSISDLSRCQVIVVGGPRAEAAKAVRFSDNRRTYVYCDGPMTPDDVDLANRLDCRILFKSAEKDGRLKAVLRGDAVDAHWWQKAFYNSLGSSGAIDRAFSWTADDAANAVAMGRLTSREAATLLNRVTAATTDHVEIPVRRGLTVLVNGTQWVWKERGSVLASAIPVVTRVYRGRNGRIRYRGHVLMNGVFPFDSSRFRKDAVAVVEAAVLQADHAVPPPFHPVIAPHVADVACYLYSRRAWRTPGD